MGGYLDYALSFLSGIGVTALVLGGAKWVAGLTVDKWLSNRFAKGLEAFKHEQQIELERLKHSINAQMDRLTRGNQREFDVLPEAWSRLTHAHGVVAATTSRLQSYPDLDRMTQPQLDDFLKNSPLAEWQRDKVQAATKKGEAYRSEFEWHKIANARRANGKFYLYFRKNGIFIRPALRPKFAELDQLILEALSAHEMNVQHNTREFKAIDKLQGEGEKLLKELENEIQRQLWPAAVEEAG